jgi:hypothetical protein
MTSTKLINILRIIIVIGLIIILLESVYLKFGDCDVCKFKIGDKVFNAVEFMNNYSSSCFKYKSLDIPRLPQTMPLA